MSCFVDTFVYSSHIYSFWLSWGDQLFNLSRKQFMHRHMKLLYWTRTCLRNWDPTAEWFFCDLHTRDQRIAGSDNAVDASFNWSFLSFSKHARRHKVAGCNVRTSICVLLNILITVVPTYVNDFEATRSLPLPHLSHQHHRLLCQIAAHKIIIIVIIIIYCINFKHMREWQQ